MLHADQQQTRSILSWPMGSLAGATWPHILVTLGVTILGGVTLVGLTKSSTQCLSAMKQRSQ
ncbi:hypothetical protein GSS87_04520 [Corynebacterium sp. 4HC-13]|uniref:Uncharacterized protein n=1 Tax=Corynebacterium anserum TaxID=2684406 RepID=A0A7G7YNL7_9CORY|nr:hypothetical protein [Corynebacterium anserum]QNH96087.1 hypothetical protein GP473_04895 [Corynebacterium anserum]